MACNLCGSTEYEVVYKEPPFLSTQSEEKIASYYSYSSIFLGGEKPHHQIVKCTECGLVYAFPRRGSTGITLSYKETPPDTSYLLTQEDRRRKFAGEVQSLTRFVRQGRILDIGCSIGIFLEEAQRQGFDAWGVELSRWASGQAAAKGLRVFNAPLQELNLENESFDIVTMWDVIEHLPDPRAELREINRVLKPGGLLVITTPDFTSLLSKVLGRAWQSVSLQHIYYFTPPTLGKMLSACGFSVVKRTTDPRISSLENLFSYFKNRRLIYPAMRRLLTMTGLGRLSVRIDPKDMIKVFSRKTA